MIKKSIRLSNCTGARSRGMQPRVAVQPLVRRCARRADVPAMPIRMRRHRIPAARCRRHVHDLLYWSIAGRTRYTGYYCFMLYVLYFIINHIYNNEKRSWKCKECKEINTLKEELYEQNYLYCLIWYFS